MNDVHCQCTSNRVPKNYIRVKSWWYLQKDTCTLQYLQIHAKMQLIWKASHEICPMSRTIHFTKGASYNDHAMHCNEMKPPFCVFKDHSVTQKLYLKWPHSYEAKILYMVLNVNFHLHKAKYIPFTIISITKQTIISVTTVHSQLMLYQQANIHFVTTHHGDRRFKPKLACTPTLYNNVYPGAHFTTTSMDVLNQST